MDKLSALLHSQRIIVVSAEYSSFKTVWEILLKPFSQRSNRIVSSFWSRARFLSEIFLCGIEFDLVSVLTASNNKDWEQKEQKGQTQLFGLLLAQLAANFHQKQKREKMMVVVWETLGEACQTRWRLGATQRREAGCLRRELTVCLDWETQLKRHDLKLTAGLALNDLKSIYQLVAKTHKVRPLDENVTGWLWQNPKLYSFVAVSTR